MHIDNPIDCIEGGLRKMNSMDLKHYERLLAIQGDVTDWNMETSNGK